LLGILAVAERHCVPIISDEIYGTMAFQNSPCPFIPLASLTATVPVIAVGGLAKQFLVPGWRCGWAMVHDRGGVLEGLKGGMTNLSQISLGANTLVQVTTCTFQSDFCHNSRTR
jgi:tyrosine aminotransferase